MVLLLRAIPQVLDARRVAAAEADAGLGGGGLVDGGAGGAGAAGGVAADDVAVLEAAPAAADAALKASMDNGAVKQCCTLADEQRDNLEVSQGGRAESFVSLETKVSGEGKRGEMRENFAN